MDSPFRDASVLAAAWREPNVVQGEEVLVADMDGRVVGCVTVEDRGRELELVNIDVPLQLRAEGSARCWCARSSSEPGQQARRQ